MKILETDRLILREFTTDDAPFILKLLNSQGWLEFIGDRGIKNTDDAKNYIETRLINGYTTNGFGLYLIELKKDKASIGMCGLLKRDGLDDIDIGFALSPEFSGNGYAFEAAAGTLIFAKNSLKLNRIVAITTLNNKSSINLLRKLNFNFEKMVQIPNDKEELMLFAIN